MRFLALFVAVGLSCASYGGSLWDRASGGTGFLFSDRRAMGMGDSVTVLITENIKFTVEGDREMEKNVDNSASASMDESSSKAILKPLDLKSKSKRKFDGSSKLEGTHSFVGRIAATVVDVLPNGNMVIAGRTQRLISGEESVMIFTGIVRPQDISAKNTVSSDMVSQARLYFETNGESRSYLRGGLLSRILDVLWPF